MMTSASLFGRVANNLSRDRTRTLFRLNYNTPYTLSVKLSDFAVWYTWRKNWANCVSLTVNSADLGTVLSSFTIVFHSEKCKVHSGNTTVSLASSQGTQLHHSDLTIHSADEHSFPNITSYYTVYTFYSSFRITLWPMWLANSKQQPCFYTP
jgi:hypothetical protein